MKTFNGWVRIRGSARLEEGDVVLRATKFYTPNTLYPVNNLEPVSFVWSNGITIGKQCRYVGSEADIVLFRIRRILGLKRKRIEIYRRLGKSRHALKYPTMTFTNPVDWTQIKTKHKRVSRPVTDSDSLDWGIIPQAAPPRRLSIAPKKFSNCPIFSLPVPLP